jgi:hypothetical protein
MAIASIRMIDIPERRAARLAQHAGLAMRGIVRATRSYRKLSRRRPRRIAAAGLLLAEASRLL